MGAKAKLGIAGLLVAACQRLEVASDDEGSDVFADSSESGEDPVNPPPPPLWRTCIEEAVCECYGRDEAQYCDVVVRENTRCFEDEYCGLAVGAEWAACLVERHCEAGGYVQDTTIVCFDQPYDCAGECDRDPAACDVDGDGVQTFACGPDGLECTFGQYCVGIDETEVCDDECECEIVDAGGWICTGVPPACPSDDLAIANECLEDAHCTSYGAGYTGHEVDCFGPDECIV